MRIRNADEVTSHSDVSGRKTVIDVLEAGLNEADPYDNVRKMIRIEGGKLLVGLREFVPLDNRKMLDVQLPLVFDLSKIGNVYVIGGGKAAQRMAKGIEDALGDLITDGQVNAKKGEPHWCKRIHVTFGGHPIPDEDCVSGSERMREIEQKAKKGDIVFLTVSGGGSALTVLPAPGITLKDVQDVTRMLLFESGAAIIETNAVRGELRMPMTERNTSEATLITIVTNETPPALSYAWSFEGAARKVKSTDPVDVLKRYNLWDRVSESVQIHLKRIRSDPRYQLRGVGEESGPRYTFRAIGPEYMLGAAEKRARELGLNAEIFASSLNDIEASAIGQTLAYAAQEVEYYNRPFRSPCAILFGGEPTVAVRNATGKGGRNQEFALAAAPRIAGSKRIVIASIDSDGTDGPTDAAGGIVDGYTMERARGAGVDVYEELSNHNSYGALTKLHDAFFTGAQGTNVRGLGIVYVGAQVWSMGSYDERVGSR